MGFDIFIQQTEKGRGVFASRGFCKGETVVVGRRVDILPERTTHSIQMDFDLHIELDESALSINHSCSPNTGVRNNQFGAYDFLALVDIPSGSEITFDYETTEYISIAIPECCCGSPECRSKILGFKFLPVEIRKKYGEFIADYLKVTVPETELPPRVLKVPSIAPISRDLGMRTPAGYMTRMSAKPPANRRLYAVKVLGSSGGN